MGECIILSCAVRVFFGKNRDLFMAAIWDTATGRLADRRFFFFSFFFFFFSFFFFLIFFCEIIHD